MKRTALLVAALLLLSVATFVGCKEDSTKSPDVTDSIRRALDQAGFKNVTVSQDRDKGIVTLGGEVTSENSKTQAESLAKSMAGGQVVADQIAVLPAGAGQEAKAINSDLDQGIAKNLDAVLIQNRMHEDVQYGVTNGVVTLRGEVSSEHERRGAETIATAVPNVKQVVNALQVVKNRKASSSQ
jgi:hyperosmotically inducible protein